MTQVGKLQGKLAIVHGAAGGIGEATCERFLAEGAKVMLVDLNPKSLKDTYEKLSAKYQGKVAMFQCDVTEENSASEAFSSAQSQFGQKCSILVNCAGILHLGSIEETTLASFNEVVAVNLNAVFLFTKEFLRRLELGENNNGDGASIINLASIAAQGFQYGASYAAAKAGVIAFTKTTCMEVGKFGVRCNALAPGLIDTAILNNIDPDLFKELNKMIPMGRKGKPVEVADACLFLASDESSYFNGAVLQVSGGLLA